MSEVLIELDERRRVSLGRIGRAEHRRYLAREEPDGTLVLVPAVVIPESQARLMANPALVEQIERTIAEPSSRVRRGRPLRKE
ncbi:MAG TPA: hypothetical protein VGJ63_15760 [Micromonosporaceae bacterium]|jgi:hypothetical protein